MRYWLGQVFLTIALGCVAAGSATAITIDVDYRYDTPALGGSNFFGSGNPQGATGGSQARAALEAAASYFTSILNDTFSAIPSPPAQFRSSIFDGVVTWFFEEQFQHPSKDPSLPGSDIAIRNPTVPADTYVIYAGAHSLPGNTAGLGSVGGYFCCTESSGGFTQAEINQINTISANFENAALRRSEPSGFARWGGTISFDTDVFPAWHFNHTTPPSGQVRDFFSVAIHELGHALGFGSQSSGDVTPWEALVNGSSFVGANAMSQNNGNPVLLSADRAHWANNTQSVVYGSTTAQETAMDPDLQNGTRKRFTALDAAAMRDIGWEVIAPPVTALFGDYNNNGVVDAADYVVWRERLGQNVTIPNDMTSGNVAPGDYTVWRTNFDLMASGSAAALAGVPEPATLLLAIAGSIPIIIARRKRRG